MLPLSNSINWGWQQTRTHKQLIQHSEDCRLELTSNFWWTAATGRLGGWICFSMYLIKCFELSKPLELFSYIRKPRGNPLLTERSPSKVYITLYIHVVCHVMFFFWLRSKNDAHDRRIQVGNWNLQTHIVKKAFI